MTNEAMGMQWGDKGCEYHPDKCKHAKDDGCEWCCMRCNTDTHWCPGCGTVGNHKNEPCDIECAKKINVTYPGDVPHEFVDSPDTMGCRSCGEKYDHWSHRFWKKND